MKETFTKNCILEPEENECIVEINADINEQTQKQTNRKKPNYDECINNFNEKFVL